MDIYLSVSTGELLDKLSILELKKNIIKDENKLIEIEKEIQALIKFKSLKNENLFYYNILKWINHQIWIFTDEIKVSKSLDNHFATLSNKIFNYNQYRFRVKNMLNSKSTIKEQKSYASDIIKIKVDFNSFYSSLTKINKLSVLYDGVVFCTEDDELIKLISNIYPTSNFSFSKENGKTVEDITLSDFDNMDVFDFPSINYISGGLLGDFVHQLSVCNETFLKTGRKANLYITDNNLEKFALGAEKAYLDLYSILNKQKYINSFNLYNGEECTVNLSIWRHSHLLYRVNWYYIFSDKYNIEWATHKWIDVDRCDYFKDVILLNVSMTRYVALDYNKLCPGKEIIFICFNKNEYDDFSKRSGTSFQFYITKNVNDMFKSISGCSCFIGNLSSPLAFAISMHKYCIGLIGETNDTVHMKDLEIPNYHYYQNENSFTKNVFDF